jgi:Kef-type K+ transport system membrane component KefB/nucleotide-binding universal stress UspA family protein
MNIISITYTALPLTDPVLKFLVILVIILVAPILLGKLKIPHLLGLIIAGAVIGPNGFDLMSRDSSIILSGTAGLLYIMFLAGLEIDLADFKKNSRKSIVFGLYTFLIPMTLGILTGIYVLNFSITTSVLLASMFASHTLIAYPLVSKLGVSRNRAVNITVGGTMITDTLALLVLAVIVGISEGDVNLQFWIRLTISITVFGLIVTLGFPVAARGFLKRYDDRVTQYIFVLVMVFLGAVLAELAGIEAIIGAFLSGLALNRLIPRTSPLMNRIEFVGNAIFIPFFLIGVGMLIDYRLFFTDLDTLKVGTVMVIIATSGKFIAAWLTQKTYRFSVDERRLIFGLSNAQAAATLAAVIVGYNIITGTSPEGEPVRLLDESVLNGTILMILVTCTIASLIAQKGARNIALQEAEEPATDQTEMEERILIPVSNPETVDELIILGLTIKSKKNRKGIYALSVVQNESEGSKIHKLAQDTLHRAAVTASATDNEVNELLRYDMNIINGITSVVMEHQINCLIMGLHIKRGIADTFLGSLIEGILTRIGITTLIYKPVQPLGTIKRHLVIVPDGADREAGFVLWMMKIWNIAQNTGSKLVFYGSAMTLASIMEKQKKHPVDAAFREFTNWDDFLVLAREVQQDDNLIVVMSRKNRLSYQENMHRVPVYLNRYFQKNSFMLVYPVQDREEDIPGLELQS